MERRQFLASLAAPVALSSAGLSLASVAPEPKPEGVEPPQSPLAPDTFFWVEREYYKGELHTARVIGNDAAMERHRKVKAIERETRTKDWQFKCARVRFSPLKRANRFLLVLADWQLDFGPFMVEDGPVARLQNDAYNEASDDFADPVSLLDIPHAEGTNELNIRSGDWLTREQAFARAAEYNAESAAEHLEEHGCVFGCDWWTVVEFGRPVAKPLVYITIEGGTGKASNEVSYPTRLVQPTDAEKARYPFSAVLNQFDFEDVGPKGGAA